MVLSRPVLAFAKFPRLTPGVGLLGVQGRVEIPASDFLCSRSQLSRESLGKSGVSELLPRAVRVYGRRCARREKSPHLPGKTRKPDR